MTTQTIQRMILAAVIAAGLIGCSDNKLKAEHSKFTAGDHKDWDRTRLGFIVEVAEQDYKVGDYDKCKEQLKGPLATDAPVPAIYVLAAKVELEGGSLELAATYLKKALALNQADNKQDPEPFYLMGVVYQRWQQMETACTYYQQAADKKPGDANYVLAVVEMQIATGKLDDAKQMLESKIAFFEQSAAMRIALARIAMLQHDPEAASKHYRDATLLAPEDNNLLWSYAGALFDAGKFSDSAKILEDLRRESMELPKASTALTKGETANDRKTNEEGAKVNRVTLLMMLGECYVNLARPANARDCFQEVIRLQPESITAYLSLGKSCLMTDDLTLTLAAAQHVLRNDPRNVQAMVLQAAAQQKQKKWSAALDTLTDAARLAPKDGTVLCMQGISEMKLGKDELAAGFFEKAVALSPTDTWARDLLTQVKPDAVKPILVPAARQATTPENAPVGTQVEETLPTANGSMIGDAPTRVTNAAPKD